MKTENHVMLREEAALAPAGRVGAGRKHSMPPRLVSVWLFGHGPSLLMQVKRRQKYKLTILLSPWLINMYMCVNSCPIY